MLERMKWLAIMITIAGVVMGAQAIFERFVYFPAKETEPTSTPTLKPSATVAPTKTTAPKHTETAIPGVRILEIESNPPGNELIGEYVLITNSTNNPIDLAHWTLRDDQKDIYTFPTYYLGSGKTVKIWTRVGVDTIDNLYWNSYAEVWNDGGDCGYLRDANGDLQSYVCY
jgi:hypothetical protein